uniref:TSA: Wollemia nobilis Ref_Wollemi_Transcript_3683_2563 transcribed RNA sequence n=1 Tax=Wollemia nobilis TaxID=56998 RepID=A0A0C9QWN6_9CONI
MASGAFNIALNSVQALGRGFDATSDIRLLYCKGVAGTSLVEVDQEHTRDLTVYKDVSVPGVSRDIKCLQGENSRFKTGVVDFHQMAANFNQPFSLPDKIPLGSFNAMFNFSGSWQADRASTKSLAMDGVSIALYTVQLMKFPLILREEVKCAVPSTWDPATLARFIETYGTHIVTSVTVGGRDVIYVKQHQSSPLSEKQIQDYVKNIADQRFADLDTSASFSARTVKEKIADQFPFNNQEIHPHPTHPASYLSGKEDVTVIFRRRGGDELVQSHEEWKTTVCSSPDVIDMTFSPITSLLEGVPGKDHLTRAISFYLEFKPPIEELRYFLEFQVPCAWAPLPSHLTGQQRKEPVCPSLQFSLMGPKLYISTAQVSVGRKPVTGLRLGLEGKKHNRLVIQLQHLSTLPKILQPHWDAHIPIGPPKWQGPEEQDSRWFEPVKWKNFSHVSTAPVENSETWIGDLSGVYIVTGAQLGVWDFGQKSVLHLRLLYSKVPGCTIRRSVWDHTPSPTVSAASSSNQQSKKLDLLTSANSSSESTVQNAKLAKIVDLTEMTKGPQDMPGHWIVSGAKLGVEKGKIVLRVKYSLLNY